MICFLVLVNPVQAVGVKVKPSSINLAVKTGQLTKTEMLVVNIGQEPAFYQLYPDQAEKSILIEPAGFYLEPGVSKIVSITVVKNIPGRLTTNISVVARPQGAGGLAAASGVKIPIMIVAAGLPFWFLVLLIIIISFILVVGVVKLKRSKQVKFGPKLQY